MAMESAAAGLRDFSCIGEGVWGLGRSLQCGRYENGL